MRLWHKGLIGVLPRQQLLSQWRECCCIAKNLADKGTPNHILVNKILDYHISHFVAYTDLVLEEMAVRGYKISDRALSNFNNNIDNYCESKKEAIYVVSYNDIYSDWHNYRYYKQCYYNLEEKFDCGGIKEYEWVAICNN